MRKISIPKGLPKCKIIDELAAKAESRNDITINILSILDEFRRRVSEEIRQINELFPEYTPHDEYYHLSRLFNFADDLLGEALIENLNLPELFILSLSLYGHDWGMAVSENEKELILNQISPDGQNKTDFILLPDERRKLQEFISQNSCTKEKQISLSCWQEYVRETHAFRSGERVKNYFEKINSGIGEATSRVCEAHWLDVKSLEDNISYPTNFAILGEIVNLKSLSIYLRLIDLLDVTKDRTPYIIWKYVAPKNLRSAMEWEKHRAIHAMSISPYQDGRIIQIEGSTKDHDVYASIIDLKNMCNEQLKLCNDLLHQINESKYNLNLFDINWRIRPVGFKPISIQFEFDRVRMFEILSDEIYQGDKYVFLRELLQNSIDAIKLRKEILEKKGVLKSPLSEFGLIEINVKHLEKGDAEITISDNGIGMNEYIVRNYLSVAGKSYYTSDDFKNLGLKMDPISKFGVGVLSCFMVADRIDIETYREPYVSSLSEKLEIHIPSVSHQFRISSIATASTPGTLFRIYVQGQKLKNSDKEIFLERLNITEYISRIAGFVDIPIKITENGLTTLILSANIDKSKLPVNTTDLMIKEKVLSFPWEKTFEPQYIKTAKKYFKESEIDIKENLKMDGVMGKIIYLEPIDKNIMLINNDSGWPSNDFTIHNERIKIKNEWMGYDRGSYENNEMNTYGKSANARSQYQVYLDGILVPRMPPPRKFGSTYSYSYEDEENDLFSFSSNGMQSLFCLPYIVVNFSKSNFKKIDLSRTELLDKKIGWEDLLWERTSLYIKSQYVNTLLSQKPRDRMFIIAQLIFYKRLRLKKSNEIIPINKYVVAVIKNKGKIAFKEWDSFIKSKIYLQPENIDCDAPLLKLFDEKIETDHLNELENWSVGEFVITGVSEKTLFSPKPMLAVTMATMSREIIEKSHFFSSIRFLTPLYKKDSPIVQKIFSPISKSKEQDKGTRDILTTVLTNINDINIEKLKFILSIVKIKGRYRIDLLKMKICIFEKPFEHLFGFGFEFLNYNHQNTKFIIQAISAIHYWAIDKIPDEILFGKLIDIIEDLPFVNYFGLNSRINFNDLNSSFKEIFTLLRTNKILENPIDPLELSIDSFVDNSLILEKGVVSRFSLKNNEKMKKNTINYLKILK